MSPFVSRPRHTGYATPGCGAHLRFTGYGMDARPHLFRNLPLPPRLLHTHTHTHTHLFNGPFSRTTRLGRYQKGKTSLDFTEARDSEWQWHQLDHMQVCTSLQTDKHASTSPLSFLQAGCPSCRPTNSVKALKVTSPRLLHRYQITQLGDRGTSV